MMIACYIEYIVCAGIKYLIKREISASGVSHTLQACHTRFRRESW